jgi:hypothetical protein
VNAVATACASNEALCARCRQAFDRKSLQPVRSGSNGAFNTFTYMCPPCAWETDQHQNQIQGLTAVTLLALGIIGFQIAVAVGGPFVFLWYVGVLR